MLVIESAANGPNSQAAYFDGSLELLRELAVTTDVNAALARLSAIVSRMLPHDALRVACFDRSGQPVSNASTADVPDMMTSEGEDVIIDDLRAGALGASAAPHATERLVGAGYRSVLGVSTRAPEPLVHVAFWSKRPLAFNRTHVPLARRIAYRLGLRASSREVARVTHEIDDERVHRVDGGVQRGVERLRAATHLQVVGESAQWREVLRKATQVAPTDTTVLITGESGTGKEVVARLVHAASARQSGPFVALNCAACPSSCWSRSCLDTSAARLRARSRQNPGRWSWRRAACCSSTRSPR